MNIEQLPVEMLMKIFKFLPTYNEVSMVSKQFYSIACQVNNSTNCLRINGLFLQRFFNNGVMDSECMESLRTTSRKVSKLMLGVCIYYNEYRFAYSGKLGQIIPIIDNFSSTIKHFTCVNIEIDVCTLMEILSLLFNVEYVHLEWLTFKKSKSEDHSAHTLTNSDLKLTKLTSLTLDLNYYIPEDLLQFFSRLPVGILTDLYAKSFSWNGLNNVLIRQYNIKNLKLERSSARDVKTDIFDKLQLESLSLRYAIECPDLATILSSQTKLKSLSLRDDRSNVDVLNAVADCLALEELTISAACVPIESFRKLGKLKKLKDFTILFSFDDGNDANRLQCFAEWDNVSLQKFSFHFFKIPANFLSALARSAPQLKHLEVDCRIGFDSISEEEAIMNSLSFVEILDIKVFERPNCESKYLNPNLRELKMSVDNHCEQWLRKCITAYPNLQKLQLYLHPKTADFSLKIGPILNGLTKLVSLDLTVRNLIVEDWDCLQNDKKNLKFVSLRNLKLKTLTDDLVKGIRANFGMLHIDHNGHLVAAVDRYTMDCESIFEQCGV